MDTNRIINLINTILFETDNYAHYNSENSVQDVKRVLFLLKNEITNYPTEVNERVLRAMHDIGMSSYKDFENTTLENLITNLTSFLCDEIPKYKDLSPLRLDFGKGNPI